MTALLASKAGGTLRAEGDLNRHADGRDGRRRRRRLVDEPSILGLLSVLPLRPALEAGEPFQGQVLDNRMNGKRTYYLCRLQLGGIWFVIWFTNDHDGLLHDSNGRLLAFSTADAALTHAATLGVMVEPDPSIEYDFDSLARWCEQPSAETIDCSEFLNAWNMLGDAGTLPTRDLGKRVYDKLFWGNNLPAVTPPGETYIPEWSLEEARELQSILRSPIDRLHAKLKRSALA
jgi:hypothetical protein